jgi:hypothetical protein
MSITGEKSAAVLTIKDGSQMTPEGRRSIAAWLRRQAKFFEKEGDQYADRFRARYLYRDETPE